MGEMRKHLAFDLISKYSSMRTLLLFGLAFILSFSFAPVYAQEATKESITMSPASSSFTIDAGKTQTSKLTFINDGTTEYDFLVYARPYSINNDQYDNPDFTTPAKNADLYGWVQFSQTRYHLKPNEVKDIFYTIRVPASAAPGGHYGVVFAEIQPTQKATEGNSVLRKKRVGSIIYATVNGNVQKSGTVTGEIPFWQVQPPLHTVVSAKNTGNTDFVDTVQLVVRDVLGNIKYQVKKDYHILPGTTRTIDLDWANSSWFGFYKVETHQNYLGKAVRAEGYVLMMPRYIPVALLVIAVIGGVYAVARRRKK